MAGRLESSPPVRLPGRSGRRSTGDGRAAGPWGGSSERMRESAFQGRKLGEAFATWQRLIDGDGLIALGLAGSLASAGLGPLVPGSSSAGTST